jgi:uncharacterized membrane protein (DUF485 family)
MDVIKTWEGLLEQARFFALCFTALIVACSVSFIFHADPTNLKALAAVDIGIGYPLALGLFCTGIAVAYFAVGHTHADAIRVARYDVERRRPVV